MLNLDKVLFMDTEHDIETYMPESIQTLFNGEARIFTTFDGKAQQQLKELWNNAEAVVFWNAPFDAGKLASMFNNTYHWREDEEGKSAYWRFELFGNKYKFRRIGGFWNLIKPMNRAKTVAQIKAKRKGTPSTPIIDLLKLWSILIEEDGSLRLKDMLKNYGYKGEIIEFSAESSRTEAYRLQDVEGLQYLTKIFLEKVDNVLDLNTLTWGEWGDIKSPATFTKRAYALKYPLKGWKKLNDITTGREDKLDYALEQAYKGGIT